ncbi:hypothetical protein V5O48_016352, partial [Marasmius crinis-equi]
MAHCFSRVQLVEVKELQAMYDALGTEKWSLASSPGGRAEVERAHWITFMWKEHECPRLETLGSIYWRLLNHPTDEEVNLNGWDTDSSSHSSWI